MCAVEHVRTKIEEGAESAWPAEAELAAVEDVYSADRSGEVCGNYACACDGERDPLRDAAA